MQATCTVRLTQNLNANTEYKYVLVLASRRASAQQLLVSIGALEHLYLTVTSYAAGRHWWVQSNAAYGMEKRIGVHLTTLCLCRATWRRHIAFCYRNQNSIFQLIVALKVYIYIVPFTHFVVASTVHLSGAIQNSQLTETLIQKLSCWSVHLFAHNESQP